MGEIKTSKAFNRKNPRYDRISLKQLLLSC
jgi:hypothetical protein